jgi:hypothetical protein
VAHIFIHVKQRILLLLQTFDDDHLLSGKGFSNWQNLSKTLKAHEMSTLHSQSFVKWTDFEKNTKVLFIDTELEKLYLIEKRHWRDVLERLVEIIKYLGRQCLALRGSSDTINARDNGNFLKLVELLSKFDVVMSHHLSKIQNNNELAPHYLGKNIQNEIISLLSSNILKHIVGMIQIAKYYAVILDCTPDISHTEQMTLIIRFVFKDESNAFTIHEHFLGFLEVYDSTGIGLSTYLVNKLSEL